MAGKRLSIFLPSLDGGGAERAIGAVASGLAERGVQVSLVLGTATGPYLADLHPRVDVVDLRSPSMLRALPRLAAHLRGSRPDVLLAAMSHANVVAALAHRLARSRARLVLSERVNVSSLFDAYRGPRMKLTGALMRLTYPWADAVVTVSEGVASDITRHIPVQPDRVIAIYNPIVDDRLLQRAAALPAHPWLATPGPPVVLAAGRLIAQKDFATLLQAFASLRQGREVRLLILGEGELREPLLAQAQELGIADDLALPGFDPNPFSSMRAASLFVLSSRFEGLPGVLIQAMACGARVVSTDCPSGPREILEGGRWGRLVPVGDAAQLAAAMAQALDEAAPPEVQARAADFSVERALTRYAEVLGVD
jgi:glycosyltransferase involved in cell wall biosynthesis